MATRTPYSTDLTDAEWAILEPLVPAVKSGTARGGRPPKYDRRQVLNGIFYVLRNGVPWRNLPHDLPPWHSVYEYFRLWRNDRTWERINCALRTKVRRQAGRDPEPSAAIVDSQSVKTTQKGGRGAMTPGRR
jgi:transposase